MKAKDVEVLKQIAIFEGSVDGTHIERYGWTWRDVKVWSATLNRLVVEGYLDVIFRTNSRTGYRLTEEGRALAQGEVAEECPEAIPGLPLALPDDIFEVIEGCADIKSLVKQVVGSEKPVHLLFAGVPSSAKTMFLLELSRTGAPYILGSQATKAGIADLLFDTQPPILLVDEIDRIGTKDIAVLLSLTQTGIVSEVKHGKRREIKLNTRVFAASNTLKLSAELLSRFMVLEFKPYSRSDFLMVATNLLQKRENVDGDLAAYIAERVWASASRFADPRQAVRIARLARTRKEADRLFQILSRYSS
jgi:Holliday junction DNA helicase RuvB